MKDDRTITVRSTGRETESRTFLDLTLVKKAAKIWRAVRRTPSSTSSNLKSRQHDLVVVVVVDDADDDYNDDDYNDDVLIVMMVVPFQEVRIQLLQFVQVDLIPALFNDSCK